MAPRETTVAASVVVDMLQYLSDRGLPTAKALAEARINPGFSASPDYRVPGSQVERLWQLAVEQTGDSLIGLHMGEAYNPGALDILGYVILSCASVGEVLEKFARYAVGQVGFLLGFSEPSAFHRAFRRWTGKTPSAYRTQIGAA